ncbi:hypothetical protein BOTNAR_1352g00030 [Botryotinia narcissicola]|uniref:Uncharacterized protein n=1 Tax=Botryotinia narcissicola TaxID=278944 RepID=A0A4Z1HAF5_9HELO|nr:hypothetical protein BOTNAR_1352g00030 [Botryotinia narcissicola]
MVKKFLRPTQNQGSNPDPSQKKHKQANVFSQLRNKTNAPRVQAASDAERDAKRFEFRGIYEALQSLTARAEANPKIQAGKKEYDEEREKERLRLRRQEIEKKVAEYRAKQNKEEELKRNGNSSAVSGEKKRPNGASASSSTGKSKRKGTAKKPVT